MSKGHNILLAIVSFFMSSVGKIEGVHGIQNNAFSVAASLRVTVI